MSDVRQAVEEHVRSEPGVHFNELARDLDIATGQAQYHLRRLVRAGDVVSESLRDRTHYYPAEYDAWERRVLALLRRETAREIIVVALEQEDPAAADLADELDVARSTISWHLSTLEATGVAEKTYDSSGRVRVELTKPAEVRRLLGAVEPTWPDKLVDRFTRLVDASFYD
ncbi:winged helix-turn-helix transcriptional regulator [Halobacteriales archaeon Cl-PHB]